MPTIPNTKRTMEAAALLLLFSFFVLIEGTLRMTRYSNPTIGDTDYGDDADRTQVPYGVLLSYACFEVFIGVMGILVAVFQLLFEMGSKNATNGFAILQSILAAFVVVTYAIAVPSIEADHTEGIAGILSAKEHRHMIFFGRIVGSICFSMALLGGQFAMILRLLMAQTNRPDTRDAVHAMAWSGNLILIAASTLCVGIFLATRDFNSDTFPVRLEPHVVWYPVISIVAGAILLVYGVAGVGAAKNSNVAEGLPFAWLIGFVNMLVNFSWTFGITPGDLTSSLDATVAMQNAGIVFAVTFLPVYHAWRQHHPLEQESGGFAKDTTTLPSEQPIAQAPPMREDSTEDMEC